MEETEIPHSAFKAITLESGTFVAVMRLVQNFPRQIRGRSKFVMMWTILAMLFVLFVPTWLSAMTGYTATLSAFVTDSHGNFIPAESFLQLVYIISDGDRLGNSYTKNYRVVVPWYADQLHLDTSYDCQFAYTLNDTGQDAWVDIKDEGCAMMWRVSNYTATYGFLGRNNTNTTFTFPDQSSINLPSPSLNISAYFALVSVEESEEMEGYDTTPWYFVPYGRAWLDPETNSYPFRVSDPRFYNSDIDIEYNEAEITEHGKCLNENDVRYSWGFSFLLLYFFIITLLVWTIGMYILYLNSFLLSRLDRTERHMGTERAVLDLSAAMQRKLAAEHSEMYSNSQLNRLVRNNVITYKDLPLESSIPTRWTLIGIWWRDFRLMPWLKSEIWWLMALVVFFVLFILSWKDDYVDYAWNQNVSTIPVLAVLHVLAVGRATRSRWLIFVLWLFLFVCLDILFVYVAPYSPFYT